MVLNFTFNLQSAGALCGFVSSKPQRPKWQQWGPKGRHQVGRVCTGKGAHGQTLITWPGQPNKVAGTSGGSRSPLVPTMASHANLMPQVIETDASSISSSYQASSLSPGRQQSPLHNDHLPSPWPPTPCSPEAANGLSKAVVFLPSAYSPYCG